MEAQKSTRHELDIAILLQTYSVAGGSLNTKHECEVAQQQRDAQVEVDKQVDSTEQLFPAKRHYA